MSAAPKMNEPPDFCFSDELEKLIPDLRAFARSLCRDATLADDLVQDAALKAWSSIASFDKSAPLKPWMFRILRNEYLQHVRRDWRQVSVDPGSFAETLVSPCPLSTANELADMSELIYALPHGQRDALILVVAAGFTYDEAGEILDCSAGTAKSRVSRAREALLVDARRSTRSAANGNGEGLITQPMARLLADIDRLQSLRRSA